MLTIDQIIHYQTYGYVVVEDVLREEDLQPVIAEIESLIDERAKQLLAENRIKDLGAGLPFETRLVELYKQDPDVEKGLDIMHYLGESIFAFFTNDRLLDTVECVLGSELMCNPIQHLRAKLPTALVDKSLKPYHSVPWHQDAAVTTVDANDSEIVTFWIPLIDATVETGCMQIIPEAFKRGYLKHVDHGATTVDPALLAGMEPAPVPCRKGGIVIMHRFTPHRGMDNSTGSIRWSLDLRYHKKGAPSGREILPSFVARSRDNPDSVLKDHAHWKRIWTEALINERKTGSKHHRV